MRGRVPLIHHIRQPPRAAALAGILFAVLFSISMVLLRLAIPEALSGPTLAAWVAGKTETIALALTLIPFAGLCFLWFMAVVRSHLGTSEDQFFSTVFLGSGLLFLAMMFVSAAIATSMLTSSTVMANTGEASGVMLFGRALLYTITNVYAVRMAAVCMIVLATIWMRTNILPRVVVLPTYALAVLLLVSSNVTLWLVLVFPAWVLLISIIFLVVDLRGEPARAEDVPGPKKP